MLIVNVTMPVGDYGKQLVDAIENDSLYLFYKDEPSEINFRTGALSRTHRVFTHYESALKRQAKDEFQKFQDLVVRRYRYIPGTDRLDWNDDVSDRSIFMAGNEYLKTRIAIDQLQKITLLQISLLRALVNRVDDSKIQQALKRQGVELYPFKYDYLGGLFRKDTGDEVTLEQLLIDAASGVGK